MNQETARSGLRRWPRSFQALGLPLDESNARDSMAFHALVREKHLLRPRGRRL